LCKHFGEDILLHSGERMVLHWADMGGTSIEGTGLERTIIIPLWPAVSFQLSHGLQQ
jgi:hypothetical protein